MNVPALVGGEFISRRPDLLPIFGARFVINQKRGGIYVEENRGEEVVKGFLRILGVFAVLVFGLLAFQNALALSFSPSGGAGVTGVLMVLFGLCALGGVGMILLAILSCWTSSSISRCWTW